MNNWIVPATITFICWGIWSFIPKLTVRYISPMSALVYEAIGVVIAGLVILGIIGFKPDTNPRGVVLALLTGLVGMTGALAFLYAVRSGRVSIVAMYTALSPVLTITLAYFILKEAVTLKDGIGIIFAFIALFLFAS